MTIYTDGACSGNPGPGGWAAVLIYGENKKEIAGFAPDTTNNRMELLSAVNALKCLKAPCEVDLYSDSAYLTSAFQKNWLASWVRNAWVKSDKKPVLNRDLWEELLDLTAVHRVSWHKVKGHANNEYNNLCDKLATDQIKLNAHK